MRAGTRGHALCRLPMKNRLGDLAARSPAVGVGVATTQRQRGVCTYAPLPPPRRGPEFAPGLPERGATPPGEGPVRRADDQRPPPHTPNPWWTTKGGEIGRGAEAAGAGRGMQPPPAHPGIGGGVRRAVPLLGE